MKESNKHPKTSLPEGQISKKQSDQGENLKNQTDLVQTEKSQLTFKQKMRVRYRALSMELREHKSTFIIYTVLRLLVILIMILQILNRNFENVFYCALTLLLLMLPSWMQINLKIELPTTLEGIILFFIFAAEIMGEVGSYYTKIPYWDTILHTMNGFLAAGIGFCLIDFLNQNEKIKFDLSPIFVAFVAFCFSMTVGIVWEFFECAMDIFAGTDMQKDTIIHTINTVMLDPTGGTTVYTIDNIEDVIVNGEPLGLGGYLDIGLYDTMKDLFVNFIGAVVFSFIGYFYIKQRGKGKFTQRFIPKLKEENADYLHIAEGQEIDGTVQQMIEEKKINKKLQKEK